MTRKVTEQTFLDKRDTIRPRKCWWMSWCKHPVRRHRPTYDKEGKLIRNEFDGTMVLRMEEVLSSYIVEVPLEEAVNGKGHKCPTCGLLTGSYVCDGFPTHTAPEIEGGIE